MENNKTKNASGFDARQLLKSKNFGILSTMSLELEGYPFGSLTPYCLSDNLEPLLLISKIAQHTKNINANPKVCLTVFSDENPDIQNNSRLTYIGDAYPSDLKEDKDRYSTYFPASKSYFDFHDFGIYKINFKRARYIGGFGKIHWVESEQLILENPLKDVEKRIIDHMNNDHQDSIIKYCKAYKNKDVETAQMLSIDSEGFDVLGDNLFFRFDFEEPVLDAKMAREVLVKMAKA